MSYTQQRRNPFGPRGQLTDRDGASSGVKQSPRGLPGATSGYGSSATDSDTGNAANIKFTIQQLAGEYFIEDVF